MLEIDAATHTGVDNVREVIIEGLSIAPVRNRYKVFLIDEVHMLSASSFNALLKSIEEPPPHVVFMMATTELHRIPDTVLSRSQIYEFRTISSKTVAERLRFVADQEGITVPDDALLLLARSGEGSMRDSLSAFDQVRAFAGDAFTLDDVTSVLGLVGRDLVFDLLDSVAGEDAAAAFALVEAAISRGYDLRILCRELARAARDLLLVSVDPARLKDPDVAGEAERPRLTAIGAKYSREDLLRAFDAFTRAEQDVQQSDYPRFQLEMALVRADAPAQAGAAGRPARRRRPAGRRRRPVPRRVRRGRRCRRRVRQAAAARPAPAAPPPSRPAQQPAPPPAAASATSRRVGRPCGSASWPRSRRPSRSSSTPSSPRPTASRSRQSASPSRSSPTRRCRGRSARRIASGCRRWPSQVLGKPAPVQVTVVTPRVRRRGLGAGRRRAVAARRHRRQPARPSDDELRQEALADPGVQALFEIFPVERTKIEEM